jgi:signal transduction histidine kinase
MLPLVALAILQTALIVVLFWQWKRRRAAERSLTQRLNLEKAASQLYAGFVHSRAPDLEAETTRALGEVATLLGADAATLTVAGEPGRSPRSGRWSRPGADCVSAAVSREDFPWTASRLQLGHVVRFAHPAELPPEAAVDRDRFVSIGVRSHVSIPLVAHDAVLGWASFATLQRERAWTDELVERLKLLAEVVANVVALRHADEQLRETQALSVAIVSSLPGALVVIDRAGHIVATNEWRSRVGRPASELVLGSDYLGTWRARAAVGDTSAVAVVRGVQAVLDGTRAEFAIEYQQPADGRWSEFRVTPLRIPAGGAVIARIDIGERKRAEAEARQVREQLTHFGRVATAGQLTAALIHEVKQPLTGILTNAQAGQRLLASPAPDLSELRAILEDIVEDDRRATVVLQRLRGMVKRREPEPAAVSIDVNRLIEDVVRFLHGDALIRHATIVCSLKPDLPAIEGDVVQLQQALVNLVLNGLDSMRDTPPAQRRLEIASDQVADLIVVSVRDSGSGIDEPVDRVFEPFFTTKPEGMGMGLPIVQSIIHAHGGLVRARNNVEGGATFWFTVPVARVAAVRR